MSESPSAQQLPFLDTAEFFRRHGSRAPGLMWLLGAGASAAARVPTAAQMTWEFKRSIFCSEELVSLATCANLEDPAVRGRIQRHFQNASHPAAGSTDEYAHYFEFAYPDDGDRRRYIDSKVLGATPSFGHRALAALTKAGRARIVWTTNFDRCVETSVIEAFGDAGRLVVAGLGSQGLVAEAITEERWPLLVKLHGDFHARRLKNTADELREQDAQLRQALTETCGRFGLIVVGYSGRDESVMQALSDAAVDGGFPQGLFWVHRGPTEPLEAVQELIRKAATVGIDAHIVLAETFDELLGDVVRQTPDLPAGIMSDVEQSAPRLTKAPLPQAGASWPVLRTNALLVAEFPSACRRVQSTIGGVKEVRAAVADAGVSDDLLVTRTNAGVLAFGRDESLRTALGRRGFEDVDLHPIDGSRLAFNSGEHGLLAEACAQALGRELPLLVRRRHRGWVVVVDPKRLDDDRLAPLKTATDHMVGKLPSGSGHWGEATALHLDWRLGRLWLLVEPFIWMTRSDGPRPAKDMDFVRERRARRFNKQSNMLLQAWVDVLLSGQSSSRISTFGGVDGVDAAFVIESTTAFSKRALALSPAAQIRAQERLAA